MMLCYVNDFLKFLNQVNDVPTTSLLAVIVTCLKNLCHFLQIDHLFERPGYLAADRETLETHVATAA